MTSTIKILLCDDHPVVRSGLRGMLASQADLEVIAEAADGSQAIALARLHQPDVVLMDLRMPKVDGIAATRGLRQERPDAKVLVLTTYETDADILRAVEVGAVGFLLKDTHENQLFGAIRDAARGDSPLTPSVAARMMERLRNSSDSTLSSREIEILRLVAQGTNNKDIAANLWISEATVKSHLNRTFEKLGAVDRTSAVTFALKRGIIRLD